MKPAYPDFLAPLSMPSEGIPVVYSSPAGFLRAASRLNDGRGPVALDTERAGEFRYDDRAFLIQLRRQDSGTILLAPEGHRQECREILAPVLNPLSWILHSATTDLPSLAMLGFHTSSLFDTELAGRLAGFDHVNLASMVERFFGISLAKGHGREDWSQPTLPEEWIIYAALDVEFLIPLAGALAEVLDSQGKLGWAEEEFEHIVQRFSHTGSTLHRDWTSMKGVGALKTKDQQTVAASLWSDREHLARASDVAVERILPRKTLISIAAALPATFDSFRSLPEMWRLRRRKIPVEKWWRLYLKARSAPPPHVVLTQHPEFPSSSGWRRADSDNWDQFRAIHADLEQLAQEVDTPLDSIVAPSAVKAIVWGHRNNALSDRGDIVVALQRHHVREWQISLALPILERHLLPRKDSSAS